MDCPRCGSPRSAHDKSCTCGHDFDQSSDSATPSETADDGTEAKDPANPVEDVPAAPTRRKKRRKKRRRPAPAADGDWANLQAQHHMPVVQLVLLYFVTCGIYGAYWYMKRQPYVDRLASTTKLGQTVPMIVLIGAGINLIVSVLVGLEPQSIAQLQPISQLLGLAVGISSLILAFRVRTALRAHGAHVQPGYDVSALGTFFLGPLYLQHKINALPQQAPIDDLVREFE